ncbi:hypothetical protein, partial [Dyella kyungheensis]
MKFRIYLSSFACALALLSGCHSTLAVTSQTLDVDQINAIQRRVETRYPKLSENDRKDLLRQVVTAVDNMVFVEGGEFDMGDFGWAETYNAYKPLCEWPC